LNVLFLRRQRLGGIASYSEALSAALTERGFSVKIEDAEKWIPNETGPKPDSKVTPHLKKVAEGHDVVHAFGYRSAWACGVAFKSYSAWFYTAYDMPKTTHELLIDKLNEAQAGICSSHAVYRALDEAIAIDLVIERPTIKALDAPAIAKEEAKVRLAVPENAVLIVCLGRLVPERGFDGLLRSMEGVWAAIPEAQLVIGGTGPQMEDLKKIATELSRAAQVKFSGHVEDIAAFLYSADVVAVPSRRAGTSMVALEAMSLGLPVLVRNTGGLPEIIDPDVSGMMFEHDGNLGDAISEVLGLPLTRQTLGSAAKIRFEEMFDLGSHADAIAKLYRGVME
jgi:glycosyltransferase involved in cell wall biosynthesis